MSMITDAIMKQMNTIGEPKTSTMTENISQESNQPMNLGSLALMLMLMMGNQDKDKATETLGITPTPSPNALPSLPTPLPTPTPSPTGAGMGAQTPPMDFIRMLLNSLGGAGR